jgi:pimeloyl-ACP methyl ester carboxylesterase
MEICTVGDSRLAYWDAGHGRPVVFIHGVATLGELWASDLADLTSECRVIVYNRRGYGASSQSPCNWDAHQEDAATLIESLSAAPASIVGYSAGATIALKLALKCPELVADLVFLEPVFNIKRCMTLDFFANLTMAKLLRRLRGDRRGAERWLRYISSYSTGGSAFENKASSERREQLLANADGIFADFASSSADVDESRFSEIVVPVTIVDTTLSPSFLRCLSQRLQQLLPQARRVTLEHSGHWAGLDARDELVKVLRDAVHASMREPVDQQ